MIDPSQPNGSVEKPEPTIQLTEAQRLALQDALLNAGNPSSQASLMPCVKYQWRRKKEKKQSSDHSLSLTGIV
jgi:hypothetical protein